MKSLALKHPFLSSFVRSFLLSVFSHRSALVICVQFYSGVMRCNKAERDSTFSIMNKFGFMTMDKIIFERLLDGCGFVSEKASYLEAYCFKVRMWKLASYIATYGKIRFYLPFFSLPQPFLLWWSVFVIAVCSCRETTASIWCWILQIYKCFKAFLMVDVVFLTTKVISFDTNVRRNHPRVGQTHNRFCNAQASQIHVIGLNLNHR